MVQQEFHLGHTKLVDSASFRDIGFAMGRDLMFRPAHDNGHKCAYYNAQNYFALTQCDGRGAGPKRFTPICGRNLNKGFPNTTCWSNNRFHLFLLHTIAFGSHHAHEVCSNLGGSVLRDDYHELKCVQSLLSEPQQSHTLHSPEPPSPARDNLEIHVYNSSSSNRDGEGCPYMNMSSGAVVVRPCNLARPVVCKITPNYPQGYDSRSIRGSNGHSEIDCKPGLHRHCASPPCVNGLSPARTSGQGRARVWSNLFTCEKTAGACRIHAPANGSAYPLHSTIGVDSLVHYQCNIGFTLVGASRASCLPTEQLSDAVPVCEPTKCVIQTPEFGRTWPAVKAVDADEHVTFECFQGYRAIGARSLQCQFSGEFDSPPPVCQSTSTKCAIHAPQFGNVRPSNSHVESGEDVSYTCELEYRLVGNNKATCNNSRLSASPPTCQATKCAIEAPEFGNVNPSRSHVGSGDKVYYSCKLGFRMVGSNRSTCHLGELSASPPICQGPTFPAGYDSSNTIIDPVRGTFRCAEGSHEQCEQPPCAGGERNNPLQAINVDGRQVWSNLPHCQDSFEWQSCSEKTQIWISPPGSQHKNWKNAEMLCQERGGDLIDITQVEGCTSKLARFTDGFHIGVTTLVSAASFRSLGDNLKSVNVSEYPLTTKCAYVNLGSSKDTTPRSTLCDSSKQAADGDGATLKLFRPVCARPVGTPAIARSCWSGGHLRQYVFHSIAFGANHAEELCNRADGVPARHIADELGCIQQLVDNSILRDNGVNDLRIHVTDRNGHRSGHRCPYLNLPDKSIQYRACDKAQPVVCVRTPAFPDDYDLTHVVKDYGRSTFRCRDGYIGNCDTANCAGGRANISAVTSWLEDRSEIWSNLPTCKPMREISGFCESDSQIGKYIYHASVADHDAAQAVCAEYGTFHYSRPSAGECASDLVSNSVALKGHITPNLMLHSATVLLNGSCAFRNLTSDSRTFGACNLTQPVVCGIFPLFPAHYAADLVEWDFETSAFLCVDGFHTSCNRRPCAPGSQITPATFAKQDGGSVVWSNLPTCRRNPIHKTCGQFNLTVHFGELPSPHSRVHCVSEAKVLMVLKRHRRLERRFLCYRDLMLKIRNLGVGTLHILTKKKEVHSETLEDTASATPSGGVAYICTGETSNRA
ncbi:uncharacterized protein LOC135828951 [Sycon ciliatum]|uniref:uncharacterized protein LOC135828951 n=1 Tax=Sycon ciliatum TaxID=27933 RepID=UPI0031F6DBD5